MRRAHRKVKEYFEKKGALVWFIHHTRYMKDIFNLWDGFMILDGNIIFIQVKSNTFPSIKKYKEFCDLYKVKGVLVNVIDRKGIKIKCVGDYGKRYR